MGKEGITRRAFRMYSGYNPKYFPLKFLQILFDNISPYFSLWMSSEIVTALYEGRSKEEVYLLVVITLFGNLAARIGSAYLKMTATLQAEVLDNREAAALNRKTVSLDYEKMENPEIRQHRRKITENLMINGYGVTYLKYNIENLMNGMVNIIFSLLLFAEMFSLMTAVSFNWLGIILFLAMIACIILRIILDFRHAEKRAVCTQKIGELLLDENRLDQGYSPSGMDNRIYCQQKLITKLYQKFNRHHLEVFSDAVHQSVVCTRSEVVCFKLSELFSYLIICLYCALGAFPVGGIIKYVGNLNKITGSISDIFFAVGQLKTNERFLQVYLDYFDIPDEMYQGSLSVEKRSDKKFDIKFRNVSFQYAGANDYALKNINLDLKVGERLAVVGRNGSGKTTFIKLLCRLYDPTKGEILMNDFNIRKYEYRQYLDLFSVVFQDYQLLSLPLGNNVASAESWNTAKAEKLLKEVGFGERYQEMPKKLETPLYKDFDEDGVDVSGGEAQKIALARALYRNAPFIILDEPTAALDPIAEAEIYARFDEIVGDKTAIYISHRLSSCRFCDRIAVFDNGEIVQIGTHEELLADREGKYYELWIAQAQYYTGKGA